MTEPGLTSTADNDKNGSVDTAAGEVLTSVVWDCKDMMRSGFWLIQEAHAPGPYVSHD